MNARSIIETILATVPGYRRDQTLDTFAAGSPDAEVRGVVVTFMATRDVLRQAVELGANFIITHEPTFFQDWKLEQLAGDPVFESKVAFLRQHGLTVWRCHDAMHRARPDMILAGVVKQLGWESFQQPSNAELFDLPETSLRRLAMDVRQKLSISHLRITGDGAMPVRRVALSCGCNSWQHQRELMRQDGVDVLLCGEVREWETCEYARDSAATGRGQGLIVLGHANSEEAGMVALADWLRPKIQATPVHYVAAGDPFWFL